MFFQDVHQRQVIPDQIITVELELVFWKVEGLFDQVDIAGLHSAFTRRGLEWNMVACSP